MCTGFVKIPSPPWKIISCAYFWRHLFLSQWRKRLIFSYWDFGLLRTYYFNQDLFWDCRRERNTVNANFFQEPHWLWWRKEWQCLFVCIFSLLRVERKFQLSYSVMNLGEKNVYQMLQSLFLFVMQEISQFSHWRRHILYSNWNLVFPEDKHMFTKICSETDLWNRQERVNIHVMVEISVLYYLLFVSLTVERIYMHTELKTHARINAAPLIITPSQYNSLSLFFVTVEVSSAFSLLV